MNLITKLILTLTVAAALCSGAYSQTPNDKAGEIIDQVLGVVGNNIILKSEIEDQYLQYKAQNLPEEGDVKCQLLEEMLFQKLLINQAELDSLQVSDKEIEGELENTINRFIAQIGSEERLEQLYNKKIREIKAEFKELIKDRLLAQKMQQKLTKDIKLTPADVQRFFKNIPKDSLPVVNTTTEIQQIARYPKISDEEKTLIREKLDEYRKRVMAGEKFSTLAKMYSEDPGTAAKGGELGLLSRTDLVPEFAGVAFKLKEPGEISRIVETEYGFHIIQLIERKGELINARHILLIPKVSSVEAMKVANFMDSLYTKLTKDTLKMDNAVAGFSEDEKSKNNGGLMYNMYTGSTKFDDEHIDPRTKLTIQDLKIGEISKPFETRDEKGKQVYKIACLKSRVKTHTANLKDDYKELQDMAIAFERQRAVKEWIKTKLDNTYIHIDESFKNCRFSYGNWAK